MAIPESPESRPQDTPAGARTGHGLLQSTSVVSAMTLLSRITGLVRDIVLARFFGATLIMDAFIVANRIPEHAQTVFCGRGLFAGFCAGHGALSRKAQRGRSARVRRCDCRDAWSHPVRGHADRRFVCAGSRRNRSAGVHWRRRSFSKWRH